MLQKRRKKVNIKKDVGLQTNESESIGLYSHPHLKLSHVLKTLLFSHIFILIPHEKACCSVVCTRKIFQYISLMTILGLVKHKTTYLLNVYHDDDVTHTQALSL